MSEPISAELSANSEPAGKGELAEAGSDDATADGAADGATDGTGRSATADGNPSDDDAASDGDAAIEDGATSDAGPASWPPVRLPQATNAAATPRVPTTRSLITM
jgi:hypothetical protein